MALPYACGCQYSSNVMMPLSEYNDMLRCRDIIYHKNREEVKKLKEELNVANKGIDAQCQEIKELNQEIDRLKTCPIVVDAKTVRQTATEIMEDKTGNDMLGYITVIQYVVQVEDINGRLYTFKVNRR